MDEYIILDFTDIERDANDTIIGKPIAKLVSELFIWDEVDRIKNDERKASIYKLGKCLLDWS